MKAFNTEKILCSLSVLLDTPISNNDKFKIDEYLLSDKIIFPFDVVLASNDELNVYGNVIWEDTLKLLILDENGDNRLLTIVENKKINLNYVVKCEGSLYNYAIDFDKCLNDGDTLLASYVIKKYESFDDEYIITPLDKIAFTKEACIDAMKGVY